MLILMMFAAITTGPASEAQALGLRLARTNGIATLAPTLAQKDITELAQEDPSLLPDQRKRLMEIGNEVAKAGIERVAQAFGAGYAKHLSLHDLRVLVRQSESPEAIRFRAAEPLVLLEAAAALGSIDLKKMTAARMCEETGKLCNRH